MSEDSVLKALRASFDELRGEYKVHLEWAGMQAHNEDWAYWKTQADKKIRGPARRWLASALVHIPLPQLSHYLQALPTKWIDHTELLLDAPETVGNLKTATALPHKNTPPPGDAETLLKNHLWRRWLEEFTAATGQEFRPPYKLLWRPDWKTTAAAATAAVGVAIVAVLKPWR